MDETLLKAMAELDTAMTDYCNKRSELIRMKEEYFLHAKDVWERRNHELLELSEFMNKVYELAEESHDSIVISTPDVEGAYTGYIYLRTHKPEVYVHIIEAYTMEHYFDEYSVYLSKNREIPTLKEKTIEQIFALFESDGAFDALLSKFYKLALGRIHNLTVRARQNNEHITKTLEQMRSVIERISDAPRVEENTDGTVTVTIKGRTYHGVITE